MKNPLFALCFGALIALPMPLIAADVRQPSAQVSAERSLINLFYLRLATYKSIGSFYMFNSLDHDQRYADLANDNVLQTIDLLKNSPLPKSNASQALKAQLSNDLTLYGSQLNKIINTIQDQGYSDLQLIADLAKTNSRILKSSKDLEQLINQEQQHILPELTRLTREQSLLIQSIATDYAARSTSVGASFFADGEKKPLDMLTEEFSKRLETLQQHPKNTAETTKELRAISVKWRYIERSLKNYNKQSVPFLIDNYAQNISLSLEHLGAQYALLGI